MSDTERDRAEDTGQRSHKGPAYLTRLFRGGEREDQRRERDRLRAAVEKRTRDSDE